MVQTTLLFLRKDGQILLAMKKRGFGIGKWNGTGGKVEPGETIHDAAVRECQEEIGVTPQDIVKMGEIRFYMSHDPNFGHHTHIFVATTWDGELHETEEMKPAWFPETEIPYETMWTDDKLWLPLLLRDKHFHGTFTLGPDEAIVSQKLIEDE